MRLTSILSGSFVFKTSSARRPFTGTYVEHTTGFTSRIPEHTVPGITPSIGRKAQGWKVMTTQESCSFLSVEDVT